MIVLNLHDVIKKLTITEMFPETTLRDNGHGDVHLPTERHVTQEKGKLDTTLKNIISDHKFEQN